ncbi:exopolyphosphatase [Pseudochrobactrum kiredjianiae]|uniref:exopolyphosphatase n=1 Tax=Pseudochrobactrum kiredjianiae TaxID=386305 RepID=A0ABW3V934_9HYPH|nr:exopolyphosphatase [Pseudochrobactrum kiredjianiae]MDM7851547.1 exopolyphosphatase [Pseudochrobactrum kiredjianiae]
MSLSVAQGRLKGLEPVAVIDIGSNSVRMVIYEGIVRAPTIFFNEKILSGLGKGLAQTGRLNDKSVASALEALRRFRALAKQAGATKIYTIATAAAREAENGPDFIARAEEILGESIQILSGREEAYYSAMGIISGFHHPNGIAGDLGGGSLELVDVHGDNPDKAIGSGITLPLGGLRLQDMSGGKITEAAKITRKYVGDVSFLKEGKGRTFYAVGGTWRNLAKLHMSAKHYPLHVMHGYAMDPEDAYHFLYRVARFDIDHMRGIEAVSKNRRQLLSYGATVLMEVVKRMEPAQIVFSALGVREGYLYSLLSKKEQRLDPLLSAAEEQAVLRSRSPRHAHELADWTGYAFEQLGYDETEDENRYRRAACLLADISWRAHPDYRGPQALNIIAHGSFIGIDHPGRAYMALANYYRHEGVMDDDAAPEIIRIATPRLRERARILGALLRVVYLLSASMPDVIPQLKWRQEGDVLALVVPEAYRDLVSERLDNRLNVLAKVTGKTLRFVIE